MEVRAVSRDWIAKMLKLFKARFDLVGFYCNPLNYFVGQYGMVGEKEY